MTNFIPTESSTTEDVNLIVDSDSFAFIGRNITIASTNENAIEVESRTVVQLDGQAVGEVGYFADGDDDTLSLGTHGVARGSFLGVESLGAHTYVENAGHIIGGVAGVGLGDPIGGELHNSGTIESGTRTLTFNAAILIESEVPNAINTQLIDNSGTIAAGIRDGYGILSLGTTTERVINTGTIKGQVFLDEGNDFLDTSHGKLSGDIDMGGGNDTVLGSASADRLFGSTGNDHLVGNAGNDQLFGGPGVDLLTGGAGVDRFNFQTGDSGKTAATEDRITDFSHAQADRIDLARIDANTKTKDDQGFHFLGTKAFTHHAGELHYTVSGGNAFVSGDLDGNGSADFTIRLDHVTSLVAADFIL